MPLFLASLMGYLAVAMSSFVGRIVLALGIGFTTYSGITVAVATIKSQAISSINTLPSDALGLIGFLWLDKGLTLIFSAVATSLAMKGIAGSIKKMVFK